MAGTKQISEVLNLTGGLTDEYVTEADGSVAAAQNMCLDSDMLPIQRPGSHSLPLASTTTGGRCTDVSNQKAIKQITDLREDIVLHTDQRAVVYSKTSGGSAVEPTGTPGDLFVKIDGTTKPSGNRVNAHYWQEQVFAASGEHCFPAKTYYDENLAAWVSRSAGMPIFTTNNIPEADFETGGLGGSGGFVSLPSGNNYDIIGIQIYEDVSGSPMYNLDTTALISTSGRIYVSRFTNPVVPVTRTDNRYVYITYSLSYKVDNIDYVDEGSCSYPFYVKSNYGFEHQKWDIYIRRPSLSKSTFKLDSVQEANMKVNVYVSTNNSTVLYQVYSQAPTPVVDVVNGNYYIAQVYGKTDSQLQIGYVAPGGALYPSIPCYINGGVEPNNPPPMAKFMRIVGNYAYYGNMRGIDKDFQTYDYPNVVYQSQNFDPDSVPPRFAIEFPDEVTGIGAAGERVIVGTKKAMYRIDGRYDETGAGYVVPEVLSRETGCISHSSMISVGDLCYFLGEEGFCMSDGVTVRNLSAHIYKTYSTLALTKVSDAAGAYTYIDYDAAQKLVTVAYDKQNNRIIWTFDDDEAYVLELRAIANWRGSFWGPWKVESDSGAFSAVGSVNSGIVRGDSRGFFWTMSNGYFSDPKYANANYNTWDRMPIVYVLKTAKNFFSSKTVKKWVTAMSILIKRIRPVAVYDSHSPTLDLQINSYNDGNKVVKALNPIHYTGDRDQLENTAFVGNQSVSVQDEKTLVMFTRRFPSPGLRCISKSLEFTNAYRLIGKSDSLETCVVVGTAAALPTLAWPLEGSLDVTRNDYYLTLEKDNYAVKYKVLSSSSATLVLDQSPGNGSGYKWKLYAFSKYQFFGFAGASIFFTPFGATHEMYNISEQGGNTGDTGEPA